MFGNITRSLTIAVLLAQVTACASTGGVNSAAAPSPVVQPNVITSDVIARAGAIPIEQLIADRVPGVQLDHGADGRAILRIRGAAGAFMNRAPLYVVDGFPLLTTIAGPPMFFSNSGIQRLEVLKDAASTAIYGVHGAGGVILIETKKR